MQSSKSRRAVLAATLLLFAAPSWAAGARDSCRKDIARPPDQKSGETLADVLMPGRKPVGQPAGSARTRDLPGGDTEGTRLFNRITAGATDVTPKGFEGAVRKLPDGRTITYRSANGAGRMAVIELNAPGIPIRRLRFPASCRGDGGGDAGLRLPSLS